MGFFSKLFGFSDNSQNKPVEVTQDYASYNEPVETKQEISPFSDFLGVDMLKSPSNDWTLISVTNDQERMMTFSKDLVFDPEVNHVFNRCEAIVIGDKFTNFIFEAPYDYHLLAKAILFIESNFVDKTTTMLRTTLKYEEEMKEYNYDPFLNFEVGDDSFSILYTRDRVSGYMRFIIRTSLCYKELNYDQLAIDFQNMMTEDGSNKNDQIEKDEAIKEIPLSEFFGIDMLKSPTKEWKLTGIENGSHRMMTFEKDIELNSDKYHVFDHCRALVLGNTDTNFVFEAPYNYDLLSKAFYFIEKNFVDKTTTMSRTKIKYEKEMKEYNYDPSLSFELNDPNLCIQYMRNAANGNMKFIIRTPYCFKELDFDKLEKEFVTGPNTVVPESISPNPEVENESDDNVSKIYVPTEDGSYKRASFSGKNMSFNDINERLGVRPRLYYVWFTKDLNINICIKAFSKDIICIVSNNDLGDVLSAASVKSLMTKDGFDYESAFDIYSRESLLDEGISEKFLTQSFMEEATHQKCMGNVLVDAINGYTYIFENGLMKAYTSSDGLVGHAKQMKDTPLFKIVKANAEKMYGNDQEVIKELNAQFKAYSNIPMDQLKIVAGYSYNYCRYYLENCKPNISLSDFLEYTHDQAELMDDNTTQKSYKYNDKIYTFNGNGIIVYGLTSTSGRKAHLMGNEAKETDLDVIYSRDEKISSICLEIEQEDSALQLAINFCQTKTQGEESKYFSFTAIGTTIIARDVYTQEYYFTTHSNSLADLLQSGKQYLGSVTDIDISDTTSPIFEISFLAIGE